MKSVLSSWSELFFITVLGLGVAGGLAGCDVDVEDQGELPTVDVEPGEAPDVDVETPEVDVETETDTVTLPDVDMEQTEVDVPSVDVDIPEEDDQ